MWLSTFCFLIISIASISASPPRITDGIARVTSHFYQQCVKLKSGNIIVSPLSIFTALTMLSEGTDGKTFQQLMNGLNLGNDKQITANLFEGYSRDLKKAAGGSEFSIANEIYVQIGYALNPKFKQLAVEKFKSGVEQLNFTKAEQSAQTMNKFVEEKTKNKIHDLITPQMLGPDTRIVLINAIYFKGGWLHPFNVDDTRQGKFFISKMVTASVDFMHLIETLNYAVLNDLDATALEMPYVNSSVSLVVILPNKQTTLGAIQQQIQNYDSYSWSRITSNLKEQRVNVTMPKFKSESSFNLNEVLKNLGMGDMFTDTANLSGLFENDEHVKISTVVHKTFIGMDEHGTEAAAATGVVGMGGGPPPSKPIDFRANRPFLYLIREKIANSILFIGSYEKPE